MARVAVPATVRRAPRYGAFLVAGALVGVVVALVVAFVTAQGSGVSGQEGGILPFLGGQNGVRWVLAVTGAVVGAFVGGGLAVLADRRSVRRRRPAPPD
ncbi:histidine kinase [Cellulomonas sp. zg-ZUI40]|nr:histidine kinase [Cellulomonas dongxiuzhuiae]